MTLIQKRFLPFLFLLITSALVLTACSDPDYDRAERELLFAGHSVTQLKQTLDSRKLTNSNILNHYAARIREISPEMKDLANTLAKEGTSKGGMYTSLVRRLKRTKEKFKQDAGSSRQALALVSQEITSINAAATPEVFNDALVDVINVLADMSNGELSKLKFRRTQDSQMPPTQHLVGNSNYGSWQRRSNGNNYWAWYGQYRLFSDVVGWGRGYGYRQDYWYRNRSPSYYGDVGRHYYGTSRSNSSWANARNRQPSVPVNKLRTGQAKTFKSASRLSNYRPRTAGAPRSMASSYASKRTSSYSNSRSSPSRSGGSSGSRGGK